MRTIMAIDLGKFKSVACIFTVGQNKPVYETIKTSPQGIHDLVTSYEMDIVIFEACSIMGWVSDLLEGLEIPYKVANTNHEKWSGRRLKKKTDRRDALWLAEQEGLGRLPVVHVPERQGRDLRALVNYRKRLVEQITQCKNSIRSILDREAIRLPGGKSGWSLKEVERLWTLALGDDGAMWRFILRNELQVMEELEAILETVEAKLDGLNENDKRVELLQTIPGVGVRTAEAVVAYIDDPHRFKNGKQVGCYLGLTPRQYQTGTINRLGRISKDGNCMLRSLLVEMCWLGLRHNPWMRQTYERIRRGSKTRSKIAIVALARRLFVRMWAMLRDGTVWRNDVAAA